MKSGLLFIFAVTLLAGCATHKTLSQETTDLQDLEDRAVLFSNDSDGREDGKGPFPRLKALGAPPKRVALVSFAVVSDATKGDYSVTSLSNGGATRVANMLLGKALPSIKSVFKANGMDVLEPSEYLTDADKKSYFQDFSVKIEGGAALLSGFMNATRAHLNGDGVATGYATLDNITTVWSFASVTNSLGGDLAKGLGVDAVLIVLNEVGATQDTAFLKSSALYMYGPNPVPLKEEDLGSGMFKDNRSGHPYACAHFKKGFKDVYLLPKGTSKLEGLDDEKNYVGYEKIAGALSKRVAEFVKTRATEK